MMGVGVGRSDVYDRYTHLCVDWAVDVARVQLIIPDDDRDRFVRQARREGLSFSAWLRAAARDRLEARERAQRFQSREDLQRFFEKCDAREGAGVEPDWEEHLRTIHESKTRDLPDV